MVIKSYRDLQIWQTAIVITQEIYLLTSLLPKHELFALTSQIRRAAISIPNNIAEGHARKGNKEFSQFLYISLGSASELETQLIICRHLEYIPDDKVDNIMKKIDEMKRMIFGLIKKLNSDN